MPKVLIIDDNESLCRTLGQMVTRLGMVSDCATSLQEGLDKAASQDFDVVFLDVHLPDGSGLDGIRQLRNKPFPPEVIIITARGDENGAETALVSGAWDYIEKTSSFQNIRLALTRAAEYRENKEKNERPVALKRDAIVGNSPAVSLCLDHVARAAGTLSPVLITGETGTGKELFARAIHDNSRLSKGNFVVVDCAALPDHLVESLLFGHVKGAFTGAHEAHEGLIEQADNGTLFLDEVGELPLSVQKKFLRVLQEKQFLPVGAVKEKRSDFRLVCATHRNLQSMANNNLFRQDLLFRIRAIHIDLPPLRDRMEDISALVLHHINRNAGTTGATPCGFSPDFIEALTAYEWPGNIRELKNTLDRALAGATDEPVLFSRHLPLALRTLRVQKKLVKDPGWVGPGADAAPRDAQDLSFPENPSPATPGAPGPDLIPMPNLISMKDYIEDMKRRYIQTLMETALGDVPEACRLSGLSRAYLYQLLQKYNLPGR